MSEAFDLAIIGAGPAGMAAALEAKAAKLSAIVLDENAAPGGQVWRGVEANAAKGKPLDRDYGAGAALVAAFRRSEVPARFGATAWAIETGQDGQVQVYFSQDGKAQAIAAARVLVATGATERPLAIPGWTIPGVMTVGAAQILWKASGLVPQGKVWLAGQGPLLRLYAVQALAAGAELAGILDLSPVPWTVLEPMDALGITKGIGLVNKGLEWGRTIRGAGVPWQRVRHVAAEAGPEGTLARVVFTDANGDHSEPADLLLLHDGVVPNTQVSRALGLDHGYDTLEQCWRPVLDDFGRGSVAHVLVAGDGAGVQGSEAALITGRLAAIAAALDLGRIAGDVADTRAKPLLKRLSAHRKFRAVLSKLYPPRFPVLEDADIVCRCEEVTAGQVRQAAELGCLGLNQMKAFTRCGMGACQGRMCATTAGLLLAEARGVHPSEIEPYRGRFPTKPLTLGELAALDGAA